MKYLKAALLIVALAALVAVLMWSVLFHTTA